MAAALPRGSPCIPFSRASKRMVTGTRTLFNRFHLTMGVDRVWVRPSSTQAAFLAQLVRLEYRFEKHDVQRPVRHPGVHEWPDHS
jgi:hypothetical protein